MCNVDATNIRLDRMDEARTEEMGKLPFFMRFKRRFMTGDAGVSWNVSSGVSYGMVFGGKAVLTALWGFAAKTWPVATGLCAKAWGGVTATLTAAWNLLTSTA